MLGSQNKFWREAGGVEKVERIKCLVIFMVIFVSKFKINKNKQKYLLLFLYRYIIDNYFYLEKILFKLGLIEVDIVKNVFYCFSGFEL